MAFDLKAESGLSAFQLDDDDVPIPIFNMVLVFNRVGKASHQAKRNSHPSQQSEIQNCERLFQSSVSATSTYVSRTTKHWIGIGSGL